MLTPQEVSEHAFAKASFGGYNMAMVDEFLDVLTADYTTLYKENATLQAKMKVLVDKVEEYRSTEEAMRKALLTAQKMADELVAQAEAKKTELLALNTFNAFCGRTGWEGVGQAEAVVFFILVVGIGLLQLRATRSKEVQQ